MKIKQKAHQNTTKYSNVSKQQFQQIKQSFDLFDTDQSGFIDTKQLKHAMISLGFQAKNKSIFNMIADLDADRNGVISFDQWFQLMTNKSVQTQSRAHYNKIFKLFDNQNTGYICAYRLQEVAKQLGEQIKRQQIIQMLKRADFDIDGLISPDQFYQIMTKTIKI